MANNALETLKANPAKLAKWYNTISLLDLEASIVLQVTVLRRIAVTLPESLADVAEQLAQIAEALDWFVKKGSK